MSKQLVILIMSVTLVIAFVIKSIISSDTKTLPLEMAFIISSTLIAVSKL